MQYYPECYLLVPSLLAFLRNFVCSISHLISLFFSVIADFCSIFFTYNYSLAIISQSKKRWFRGRSVAIQWRRGFCLLTWATRWLPPPSPAETGQNIHRERKKEAGQQRGRVNSYSIPVTSVCSASNKHTQVKSSIRSRRPSSPNSLRKIQMYAHH